MLSTFPTGSPFESMLGNPFPTTPWECHDHDYEFWPAVFQLPEPAGLDVFQSPNAVISSPDSEDRDESEAMEPGPYEPDREVRVIDERKRRRMESNRESARRSRMRKQKHLENLKKLVNKLKVENREMSNQLRFAVYHVNRVRRENEHLQTEHTILRRKLLYSRQVLIFRQFQRQLEIPNNNNLINC